MFQEISKFAIFFEAKLTHSLDQLQPEVKRALGPVVCTNLERTAIWQFLQFGDATKLVYFSQKKLLSPCLVFSLQKALA